MSERDLNLTVQRTADALLAAFGKEAAIIVMVGIPDGVDHSKKQWAWRGRCLPVEGLLERCGEEIRKDLW